MNDGLIVLRTDGSVQAFDRGAERILGLSPGELRVGFALAPLLGREILARLFDAAPLCEAGEVLGSGELSFHLGDQWVTARATRLSDAVSSEPCVLVRLAALGGVPLGAGRDLAARLSRELRAPVAAIRGCSQTLLGGALEESERARRFLEMMDYNADQLELIANDLDAFAQVEPHWIRENRRAVDVRPVLGWTAKSHANTVLRRGVAVRALPLSDDVVVAAVPQLFERSLQGLVGELVRVARKGDEITCSALRVSGTEGDAPAIAEIAVERRPVGIAHRDHRAGDEEVGSLRMETVRDVVRVHGGWLSSCGSAGRLDAVKMFWPLWSPECGAARVA